MTTEEKTDAGLRRLIRANVRNVVFEVVVPMALFYGLRAAGVSQWWALMAGILVAAPYVAWTVARTRKVDLPALVTISVLVLSVVLGLLSDDPRTLVIREGWTAALGGLFGAWMLVSVFVGRPALADGLLRERRRRQEEEGYEEAGESSFVQHGSYPESIFDF